MDSRVARALQRSRAGEPADAGDVLALLTCPDGDLPAVLQRARELRDEGLAAGGLEGIVTYSRKVFIPLTRLCRYRCSYCTFVTPRAAAGREYLSEEEVVAIARGGREWGCTEALFTLGEAPELRHPEAARWLASRGFASTVDYLVHCAGLVVRETGLLPHVNAGAVCREEMERLRTVCASQGLMMEQLSDRLLRPGQAHAGAPGKAAAIRLGQLAFAADTHTPFTTGLLVGIGETPAERAATILAIRDADRGQIQEVIVQNFRAKARTPMAGCASPEVGEMLRTIAAVRIALGPGASVQAPPNLTPGDYVRYLDAGINDWGGVSPFTPDHVNPEMPWPGIGELAEACASRGFALRQRLPVYPRYLRPGVFEAWIAPPMRRHVLAAADAMGLAREERWYAGEGWTPVLRAAPPRPRRRALALAEARPALRAEEVFSYGGGAGCADPSPNRLSASRADPSGDGLSAGCADPSGDGLSAGCADPSGAGRASFDDTLPDLSSRTVLAHERADRHGHWVGVYRSARPPAREVEELLRRARQGQRLSEPEVERLLRAEGAELWAVIREADEIRREVCGDTVTYVVNRNITYTNFCHTGCGFCGFARPLGHPDGYYLDPPTIGRKAAEAWELGATEVCVQGGIHPRNDGRIYLEIARAIKEAAPQIHLHGFSPLEITVGARTLGLPLDRYLRLLAEAGVDTIPGTAAEILDEEVRPRITPEKLSAQDWLELMEAAHAIGLRSTATIMFGHIDHPAAWARHLLRLRDLQARTGGFTEIIPLPFVHHRAPIFMRGSARPGPTWREVVKLHAVARVVLHPVFRNVQASWVKCGVEGVVALLEAGVNDFGGTLMEEHISRMAGATHGVGLSPERIEAAIRAAGRVPRQRTTTYGTVGRMPEAGFVGRQGCRGGRPDQPGGGYRMPASDQPGSHGGGAGASVGAAGAPRAAAEP